MSQSRRIIGLFIVIALMLSAFVFNTSAEASGTVLTHATAASRLSAAGITWTSSGNCSNRNISTCTSFDGIYSGTIDGIITLRNASGCAINVTGGTEIGHATTGTSPAPSYATHGNGYKIDTSFGSGCIENYIRANFTQIASRSNGDPQWQSAAGNIYAKESTHWDIYYR